MSRVLARLSLCLLSCQILFCRVGPAHAETSLDTMLEPYLARYDLPALAAAVTINGKMVAVGAVGTRKAGTEKLVKIGDRFHLGSDTKAMTALLAAMFVEAGKLRWDSTIAEVFPELTDQMVSDLRGVTLQQLLSHTSGIPSDNEAFSDLIQQSLSQDGNLDELRSWLVQQWVKQPLASTPGTEFAYANINYIIAGAMLERVSGKTWEELITERIFDPLELQSAGLGPQATLGRIDAPLGHQVIDGKIKAFLAGPNGDNPLIIGPAGTAHMSIVDFAKWAAWNAGQGTHGPHLISQETLKKLQTPVMAITVKKDGPAGALVREWYGLGWGIVTVNWASEPLLQHSGSNEKNLAQIWLDPKRDFAMVLATNISGPQASDALLTLAKELYAQFATSKAGETITK